MEASPWIDYGRETLRPLLHNHVQRHPSTPSSSTPPHKLQCYEARIGLVRQTRADKDIVVCISDGLAGGTLHFSSDAPEVSCGRLRLQRYLHWLFRLLRFGASSTLSAAFAWSRGKQSKNNAMTAIFVSSHHPIPRQPGSRDDLGPFLNVVTWILLITSALAVLTRLVTKRALRRRIDIDDAFALLALVRKAHYDLGNSTG